MKITLLSCVLLTSCSLATQAASFNLGDLLLLRVGDGVNPLANSGGSVSLLEVNTAGALVQPAISIPSGNGGLQISGTATSEGQLVRNADGTSWTLAGYVPPFTGSGSLSGRSGTQAPRGFLTIDSAGTVSSPATLPGTAYSGQNIRSGLSSGSSQWFAGSGTSSGNGLVSYNGSSATTIQGINSRVLGVHQGNLLYSTGSGTQGIYSFNGMPTASTTATAFLTGIPGQGTSPYDFAFSPDGNILYVADDGIGVQKFTFDGSIWTLAYNFTSGASANKAYGLAVDFSGEDPAVYWTTPTDLWAAVDKGAAATGTSILSAGPNYYFRGLDIVSVPEPAALALLGLGALVWLGGRRSRHA